jgi:electron transport complex protein RnfA
MATFSLPLIAALFLGTHILAAAIGLRTPRNLNEAFGLGGATAMTLLVAATLYWPIQHLALQPLGLQFLDTMIAVLLIATCATLSEALLHKKLPLFFPLHGNLLPQILVGATIVALPLMRNTSLSFGATLLLAFIFATGTKLLTALFYLLREHGANAETPAPFRGPAIDMLNAGLLVIALGGIASIF